MNINKFKDFDLIKEEFISDFDIIESKSAFFFYDGQWNFPMGDNIGFDIVEERIGKPLTNEFKSKLLGVEKRLNQDKIHYHDLSDDLFIQIWNGIK